MCQQQAVVQQQQQQITARKMKATYSIKKVLKLLFKKQQQQQQHQQPAAQLCDSQESLEWLENQQNTQTEEQYYEEIGDNAANEKLADMSAAEQDIYVPVRFARTDAGTFFWTTNLKPVAGCSIAPLADEDLLQPAYCYSSVYDEEVAHAYGQDRWAQA